jgi:hypothetical protein
MSTGSSVARCRQLAGLTLLLTMLVSLLAGMTGTAAAVEGEGEAGELEQQQPLPPINEVGSQSDIAREYLPEPYQEPSWFQWLRYPLLIVGIIATGAVLFAYLVWQPKFADEQRRKRRR